MTPCLAGVGYAQLSVVLFIFRHVTLSAVMYIHSIQILFLTLNRECDYNEESENFLCGKDALRTGDQQRNYPGLSSEQVSLSSMLHRGGSIPTSVI